MQNMLDGLDTNSPHGTYVAGPAASVAWAAAMAADAPQRRDLRHRASLDHRGPYDCTADGVRMRVYPAENYCDRVVIGRNRLPESDERSLIAPLVRRGMVFVDIGANVGVYSLFVSALSKGACRILAFEPNPRTYAKLAFNQKANGFTNLHLVDAAVGAGSGEAALFLESKGNAGRASMVRAGDARTASVPIRVVTLNAALNAHEVAGIDLLKIDVEGFEAAALMPFFRTAPRTLWPRHILLETVHAGAWAENLLEFLESAGYGLAAETSENALLAI